jgi:hypothetical protein
MPASDWSPGWVAQVLMATAPLSVYPPIGKMLLKPKKGVYKEIKYIQTGNICVQHVVTIYYTDDTSFIQLLHWLLLLLLPNFSWEY